MTRYAMRCLVLLVGLLATLPIMAGSPAVAEESMPSAEGAVTIGDTEVTWTGDWQVDTEGTSDEQVALTHVDMTTNSMMIATYSEVPGETVESVEEVLASMTAKVVDPEGSLSAEEVASGDLMDGGAWKLFSFQLGELAFRMLIAVGDRDDGDYRVSTLTANVDAADPAAFGESLGRAQEEIALNGEPTFFAGIDPEQLAAPVQ